MLIGELAERAGTSTRTLRYYEEHGLVQAGRDANGYRRYDDSELRVVHEIRALLAVGFGLDDIRPFVACLRAGNQAGHVCPRLRRRAPAQARRGRRLPRSAGRRARPIAGAACPRHRTAGDPMPEDSLITVTDATFADVVLKSTLPIAVDFWAELCPPCRPMAKTLSELAAEYPGQITFAKINADENPEATRAYRVMSMPTLLVFKQGQVVKSIVGARPKSYLREALTTSTQPYANR